MRSHRLIATAFVMTAVVASCSSGHGSAKVKATATTVTAPVTTASTTTSTTVSPEAAVLAAYRASWDEFLAVGAHPDPVDPRLAAHSTGGQLAQLRQAMQKYIKEGVVEQGTIELQPRVVALASTTATVHDCYLSHIADVDATTGQVRKADPQVRVPIEATLVLEAGVWKVSSLYDRSTECTSG